MGNYDLSALNSKDYDLETEINDEKIRVGIYIKNKVPYKRRKDLEEPNCHIIIVDVFGMPFSLYVFT